MRWLVLVLVGACTNPAATVDDTGTDAGPVDTDDTGVPPASTCPWAGNWETVEVTCGGGGSPVDGSADMDLADDPADGGCIGAVAGTVVVNGVESQCEVGWHIADGAAGVVEVIAQGHDCFEAPQDLLVVNAVWTLDGVNLITDFTVDDPGPLFFSACASGGGIVTWAPR